MKALTQTMRTMVTPLLTAAALVVMASAASAQTQSGTFSGAKVNGGSVTYAVKGAERTLTLSADFKVPDTPDPHWQVVDSRGQVFLLQKLTVKGAVGGVLGDRTNTTIALPAYIRDVAKVQIYCAWAEALLGEASFRTAIGSTE
jgi:hypothetical protein